MMQFDENKRAFKVYDGKQEAKLGTVKHPAAVSVQTKTRAKEIEKECKEHGWECRIEVNPKQPENIADLKRLQKPPKPVKVKATPGRNDPCPCGSGKKYKKCCGK